MKCGFCGKTLSYWTPDDTPVCDACMAQYDVEPKAFVRESEDWKRARMLQRGGPEVRVEWSLRRGGWRMLWRVEQFDSWRSWEEWAKERGIV